MASMRRSTMGFQWLAFLCLETNMTILCTWRPKEQLLDWTFSQCLVQICTLHWRQSLMTLPIRRMPCGYQEFTMISQWSPWTEQSSGLSLSCVTKEPSIFVWQPMTSAGSNTTLWMCLGSCWPVCWLWCSSSKSVASFVARSWLKLEGRRKGSSWTGEDWHMVLSSASQKGRQWFRVLHPVTR